METSKKNKRLNLRLGEYHDEWLKIAKDYNVAPSSLAAALIKSSVDEYKANTQSKSLKQLSDYLSDDNTSIDFHIRLRKDEVAALTRLAEQLGKSLPQTITSVVRSFTVNEPQYTLEEVDCLDESNYELNRIGVNLNQIAHQVNMMDLDVYKRHDAKTLKTLLKRLNERTDKLNEAIKLHVEKVWTVINSGRHRVSLIKGDSK